MIAPLPSAVTEGRERRADGAPVPSVFLTLPMPPSVNEMFRNTHRGRVKTSVYLDWRGHAGWVLRDQKPGNIGGPVLAILSIERGSAQADIDNRVKAIFDLLVAHRVIDDDRFVVGFCIAWAPAVSKLARVMILPAATYDFTFQLADDGRTGGWFIHAPMENADVDQLEGPEELDGDLAAAHPHLRTAGVGQDLAGDGVP